MILTRPGLWLTGNLGALTLGLLLSPTTANAQSGPPPPPPGSAPPASVPSDAPPAPAGATQPAATPGPAPAAAPVGQPAPAGYEPPPPPAPEPRGAYLHDGFYLRLGLGGGALRADGEASIGSQTLEYEVSGGGFSLDLMIGGTISDGLVLGGAYWFNQAASPEFKAKSSGQSTTSDADLNFGIIGPFIDGFFDPEGGFHLGGMLGAAVVTVTDEGNDTDAAARGFGAGVLVGYDAWIGKEWSLGGYLRASGGSVKNSDSDIDETITVGSVALMFSVLHH